MTRSRRVVGLLAVLSMLITACGDDDSTADALRSEPPRTDTDGISESESSGDAAARSDEQHTADQEALDRAILSLDDMPTGWEQQPLPDESDVGREDLARCVGEDVDRLYDDDGPTADAEFASADDQQVSVGWTTAPTIELATFRFGALTSDTALACMQEVFVHLLTDDVPDGVDIGDVTVNRMSFPSFGDDSIAARTTIPLAAQGMQVDVYFDAVFVRAGRALGTLSHMSMFSPPDSGMVEELVQTMVDKLDPAAVS